MNDNQEVKIGMTDGDDSQELQPTCMRAFDGWVSVDTDMPSEDCETYIVFSCGEVTTCQFNKFPSDPEKNLEYSYRWYTYNNVPNWGVERVEVLDVTHWRPLPPPPVK